jgi:cold shock CspA family protein
MTTEQQTKATKKLLGRVQRVIPRERLGYGFIITDDYKKFFFHQQDVAGQVLPVEGSRVNFDVVKQTVNSRNDVAVNIEIVSVPG